MAIIVLKKKYIINCFKLIGILVESITTTVLEKNIIWTIETVTTIYLEASVKILILSAIISVGRNISAIPRDRDGAIIEASGTCNIFNRGSKDNKR